jgi:hypothetical protein
MSEERYIQDWPDEAKALVAHLLDVIQGGQSILGRGVVGTIESKPYEEGDLRWKPCAHATFKHYSGSVRAGAPALVKYMSDCRMWSRDDDGNPNYNRFLKVNRDDDIL